MDWLTEAKANRMASTLQSSGWMLMIVGVVLAVTSEIGWATGLGVWCVLCGLSALKESRP
jgi:hypothetical protein